MPRVGIVILHWRRPAETLACLASLARLSYPSVQVIVVDNGSEAGTLRIREQFPSATVIENGRNLGFAGGSNVGIRYLVANDFDYVLLLNDDTEVATDLLDVLVREAEADPRIGILGPTIYYHDAPNVIWSAGGTVDFLGRCRQVRADRQEETSACSGAQDFDYVTGCALLVRRELIESVGALDERFFAYFEETEWCARARRAGYRVVYVPRTCVWHKIVQGERAESRTYVYFMTRNRLLYLLCGGASTLHVGLAVIELLRTAMSWAVRPKHHARRRLIGALVWGVTDFTLKRFGAAPAWL